MTDHHVAKTIQQQIGHRAFVMLGAKKFVAKKDGLIFRIGRNDKKVNMIEITLTPSDTYSVRFLYARGLKMTERSSFDDVYVGMLHELIESETGMYTSLGTMGGEL